MSEERKITLKLDLDLIQETAKALGYKVEVNGKVKLYYREEQVDLVVTIPHTNYTLGFKKTDNGIEMIHDDMIKEKVNEFVVEAYKTSIEKKLHRSRFKMTSKTLERNAVVLRYSA